MKIWTGNTCRSLPIVLTVGILTVSCSTTQTSKPAETSLKQDREAINDLRKEIPEEIRKSNDHLAETLNRWKVLKKSPEDLREKLSDEIRKMRAEMDKRQHRKRDDFQKGLGDRRKEFQNKQKDNRDDFLGSKPKQEARSKFMDRQSIDRDRFQSDQHDERNDFEEAQKDERKTFEADIAERWTEFRQEYPEYQRLYKEMRSAEEKQKEEEKANPKPYAGWPYRGAGEEAVSTPAKSAKPEIPGKPEKPENVDVNKGQDGWPSTDASEFDKMGK